MPMHNTANSIPQSSTSPGATLRLASAVDIDAALGDARPTSLQILLQQAHRVQYAPHEVVYHAGSANETLIFITEGLVKLVAYLHNGRERIVRLHRAGEVLGLGALRGWKHEQTAITLTTATTLRLPVAALQRLRSNDPQAYAGLLERWQDYLREADTWITDFSTGPIRGRVARLLAFLAKFDTRDPDDQVQLLTCEEMGAILGVTSESTSRILAEFKRQGILTGHVGDCSELFQTDVHRLQAIARNE